MMNESLNWVEDEVTNDETQLTNSSPAIGAENLTQNQFESKSKEFLDRRKAFVIRDDAGEPHESYLAFKSFSFKSSFHAGGHQKTKKLQMSAFAVSEHGNETFTNVIRTFLITGSVLLLIAT